MSALLINIIFATRKPGQVEAMKFDVAKRYKTEQVAST